MPGQARASVPSHCSDPSFMLLPQAGGEQHAAAQPMVITSAAQRSLSLAIAHKPPVAATVQVKSPGGSLVITHAWHAPPAILNFRQAVASPPVAGQVTGGQVQFAWQSPGHAVASL